MSDKGEARALQTLQFDVESLKKMSPKIGLCQDGKIVPAVPTAGDSRCKLRPTRLVEPNGARPVRAVHYKQ